MRETIRAKLVAKTNELYANLVFQNLDVKQNSIYRYVTVTKCPNWQYFDDINIGDIGFLEYDSVEAGQDYLRKSDNKKEQYKYDALYFINFVKEQPKIQKQKYTF